MREPVALRARRRLHEIEFTGAHQLEPRASVELEEAGFKRVRGIAVWGTDPRAEMALVEVSQPLEVARPDGDVFDPNHGPPPRRQTGCAAYAILAGALRTVRPVIWPALHSRPAGGLRVNAPTQTTSATALVAGLERIVGSARVLTG